MRVGVMIGMSFLLVGLTSILIGSLMFMKDTMYLLHYNLLTSSGYEMEYDLVIDYISLLYLGVVSYIGGSVMIYSEGYMEGDIHSKRLLMLVILFVFSSLLMVMSSGSISVMLGWDGLGLSSYCLVIYYQSKNSFKAGSITLMMNRVGDVLLLLSMGGLCCWGEWDYVFYSKDKLDLNVVGMLIVVACFTKSAQLPFSAWLPEASAAPTPVSSLVHSSTLVTAGVYLLVRFNFVLGVSYSVALVGLGTMLLGSLNAMVEMDMKKVIASSTLSQLGFMILTLGSGYWMLSYFHMIMHAFFKALSFLCSGMVISMLKGEQDFRRSGGFMVLSPFSGVGIMYSILCLGGLPFTCGFFSKDLILEIFFMGSMGSIYMVLYILGLLSSLIYSLRMMMLVYLNGVMHSGYNILFENFWMKLGVMLMIISSVVGGSLYCLLVMEYLWFVELGTILKMLILLLSSLMLGYLYKYKLLGDNILGIELIFMLGGLMNLKYLSFKMPNLWSIVGSKLEEDDPKWVEDCSGMSGSKIIVWLMAVETGVVIFYVKGVIYTIFISCFMTLYFS